MADLIDRQKIKAKFEPWLKVKGYSEGELNMLKAVLYEITVMPSAQPERLTDDDFETIRIHLNAYKEKLCNQHRWEEADEYQRIIDRFMSFASAQPDVPDTNVGDMISRQAAIDALDVLCQEHRYKIPGKIETYSQYNEAWQDALDRAEGAIGNLPSAQPEQRWIPCSERLPEDIRPVIVTWKNTDPKSYYQYIVGKHFIGTACYTNGKWYWYSSTTEDILAEYGRYDSEEFDEAIECIAWMPLPEPYKGGVD